METKQNKQTNKHKQKELRRKKIEKEKFAKPNVNEFISMYFVKEDDFKISKNEFLRYFNVMNKSKVPWSWLLEQLQKNNIQYDNQATLNNVAVGCVIGLNYKDDILGLSFCEFNFE